MILFPPIMYLALYFQLGHTFKGKGKCGGYSLKATSMTCSADFTSTFPGIGTHTNTISSPRENAAPCLCRQLQPVTNISFIFIVPQGTCLYCQVHRGTHGVRNLPKVFLHMTRPRIEPRSLDRESKTLTDQPHASKKAYIRANLKIATIYKHLRFNHLLFINMMAK